MDLKTQFKIKNNPYIARYLKENSYWYKILTRDSSAIELLEKQMKEDYRLTPKDKIEDLGKKIEMIQSFIDILSS